ncbi:hypothetical protein D3C76_1351950 [compost metagenome]
MGAEYCPAHPAFVAAGCIGCRSDDAREAFTQEPGEPIPEVVVRRDARRQRSVNEAGIAAVREALAAAQRAKR